MASKSGRMLGSQSSSQVYPTEPTPLHFTQLMYPKSSVSMPPPATYRKPPRSRRSCVGCCCCSIFATLCSLLFTLLFLLGLAALITWLALRPIYAPKYSVESLDLKTFNVTPQGRLNADAVYTIVVSNPNKKLGFQYDVITLETSYGGQVFGRSSIPRFTQGHRNVTTLTSGFVVESLVVANGTAIAMDVERGSVEIHARASARVRVKVSTVTSFAMRVRVNCDFTMKPPTATELGSVITKTCKLTR